MKHSASASLNWIHSTSAVANFRQDRIDSHTAWLAASPVAPTATPAVTTAEMIRSHWILALLPPYGGQSEGSATNVPSCPSPVFSPLHNWECFRFSRRTSHHLDASGRIGAPYIRENRCGGHHSLSPAN